MENYKYKAAGDFSIVGLSAENHCKPHFGVSCICLAKNNWLFCNWNSYFLNPQNSNHGGGEGKACWPKHQTDFFFKKIIVLMRPAVFFMGVLQFFNNGGFFPKCTLK